MYNTYKYYDKKGRRLAVFCRFIDADTAELITFVCSKEDQFKKAFAIEQYNKYVDGLPLSSKPIVEKVEIQPEESEIKLLIRYCREKYYTFGYEPIKVEIGVLYGFSKETIIL